MFGQKKYDLIGIGDIVTDAFIRLEEAHVNCKINSDECEICMRFGDKIPYEFVEVCPAVGNSSNGVVSAARLGLSSAIISNVGDDTNASDALNQFKKEKVGTEFIALNKAMKTNYHYVLWFQADRTILIKHEKYPYLLPKMKTPKWIYLSSLGESSLPFHKIIEKYLQNNPDVKLAFQPGTYQIKFGPEELAGIYKRTEVFACNIQEAEKILKIEPRETNVENVRDLSKKIASLGPKTVCLTDGSNGAYVYEVSGGQLLFMPTYPDSKPPYERTGAGDAFFSTFISALIKGKTTEEALMWAPINSMSVVQEIGAQKGLLSEAKLLEYLSKAPESYKPKAI